jgi:IS1 family transposase
MRDLPCERLELDEIWGFIGKKQGHLKPNDDPQCGDVWTFCAIDSLSKAVPCFRVGKRDKTTANAFVSDLASRLTKRVQISTDGLRAYVEAIGESFDGEVDYGQIVKNYATEADRPRNAERKYSAPRISSVERSRVFGNPDMELVSTSYVERLTATTRLHMRRLTRLTLAFSKKLENFQAAVALHFAYYNFVRRHATIKCTPAMAVGVESRAWTVGDLLEAATT